MIEIASVVELEPPFLLAGERVRGCVHGIDVAVFSVEGNDQAVFDVNASDEAC